MDFNKTTYTIDSIDKQTGNVCVTFDFDGKQQCLANMPLENADGLKDALSEYLQNYMQGFRESLVTVPKGVDALVGKQQTADIEG